MITTEAVREKLTGYPESVLTHYETFAASRDPEELHAFVIGLIQFLQDSAEEPPATEPGDATNLRGDMGVDSITIAEVVFLLEEILEIEIDNEDLAEIETIGDLKAYILRKLD